MADANVTAFEEFFQEWMVRQRGYLDELVSAQQHHNELQEDDRRQLANRVICHYGEYYEKKSRIAHHNVLLVFSPPWFTSLEKTFLWVAGFKPGLTFQVVYRALDDLSEEQRQGLSQLNQEIKLKERDLNDELAKVQESFAGPSLLDMVRNHSRVSLNGSFMEEEGTVPSNLKETLETLVANGDALRTNTALRVVKILTPAQVVKFFVVMAELHLRIRSLGMDKDNDA